MSNMEYRTSENPTDSEPQSFFTPLQLRIFIAAMAISVLASGYNIYNSLTIIATSEEISATTKALADDLQKLRLITSE